MYSNESKNGFSVLDLLVKIIFAAIFIFILIWLFQKKIPNVNMTPFYSNVFRENIKYMQEAGESYFTNDKLPTVSGESVKLTLEEMERLNLVLPFVDQDGNACNKTESYVSITKLEGDLGYELKTNLVCGKESNFTVKTLGCHVYCPNNGVKCDCNCNQEKKCSYEKITEYQFKKLVSGTKVKYSCDKKYSLKGKYCYKMVLEDTKSALVTKTREKTLTQDAKLITEEAKYNLLKTVVTPVTDTKDATPVTSTDVKMATPVVTTDTKDATPEKVKYTCTKVKTETRCTTRTVKNPYSCNCKTTIVRGKSTTTCDTCYETVQVQDCKDVEVEYDDTCTKTVYNCKKYDGYTLSGKKCIKEITTYNCNKYSGYTLDGNKCKKTTTTYNCNKYSGYTLDGKKCKKTTNTYSCPKGTDVQEGSGANLKCYQVIAGKTYYKCTDSTYTLSGTKCYKVVSETYTDKDCSKYKGYVLEGDKCKLYKTDKVKAKVTKTSTSSYSYKWSTSKELSGWTATGKTRTVKGKKVCK